MSEERRREFLAREVQEMMFQLFELFGDVMSALTDLQAAVATLDTEVGLAVAALKAPVTIVGTSDAQLAPVTAAVAAAAATLAAAIPVPVAPAPVAPAPPVAPAA